MSEHNMKLQRLPFDLIRAGQKTVELRLYDEKRKSIRVGDKINFSCEGDSLTVTVLALHRFSDFAALYEAMPHNALGSDDPKDMEQYYSLEAQRKYGVLGIEIG